MDIENFLHREELTKASLIKRSFAFMIDSLLLVIIIFFIYSDMLTNFQAPVSTEQILFVIAVVSKPYLLLAFLYHFIFTVLYGASIGKIIMKIRIIDLQTGSTPNVVVSLNRSAVRVISEFVNILFIWAFLDQHRQALHDKSAKTLVINA